MKLPKYDSQSNFIYKNEKCRIQYWYGIILVSVSANTMVQASSSVLRLKELECFIPI